MNSGSDSLVLYYPFSMAKGIARNTGSLMLVTDDAKQAQKSLEEVVNASGETYTEGNLYDAREEYRDAENALIVVRVFAYGFITLMSLICVANVFNTTTTNVLLRRRDFAMLRSAGMTRGGLNRMICYECLLYGTRALLIGLPLSVLMFIVVGCAGLPDVSLRLFHRRVALPAGLDGCAHRVCHGVPRCVSLNDVCHAQDQARQSR